MVTTCPRTDKIYQFAKSIANEYRLNDSELYRYVFIADIFRELGMNERVLIRDLNCGGDGNAVVLPQSQAVPHARCEEWPEGYYKLVQPHPSGPSTETIHDARKVRVVRLPDDLREINFYKEAREQLDQLVGASE